MSDGISLYLTSIRSILSLGRDNNPEPVADRFDAYGKKTMSLSEPSSSREALPELKPESQLSSYGWTSIALHWIGAIAILVSFLTGEAMEGGRGNDGGYASHVAWAAILAIPLTIRVVWRMIDGFKKTTDPAAIYNIASKVVMVGFLICIALSILTGILLPWSLGNPLEIWSLSIPSPLARMRDLHEVMEETHEVVVHLFIPLVALHIAGALKHAFYDRDGVMKGIFVPNRDR